jgi:hypothetical protein
MLWYIFCIIFNFLYIYIPNRYNLDMLSKEKATLIPLEDGQIHTKAEVTQVLRGTYPSYSRNSLNWKFSFLLQKGLVKKTEEGYRIPSCLKEFHYDYFSPLEKTVSSLLKRQFPDIPIVAFDLSFLNAWLNQQIPFSTLFVEAPQEDLQAIFEFLQNSLPNQVLLHPSVKELSLYQKKDTVILERLLKRTPLWPQGNPLKIEKLIVDLLFYKNFTLLIPSSEIMDVIEQLSSTYEIDFRSLRSYSKKRGYRYMMESFLKSHPLEGTNHDHPRRGSQSRFHS